MAGENERFFERCIVLRSILTACNPLTPQLGHRRGPLITSNSIQLDCFVCVHITWYDDNYIV